ncbi:hypothetical protein NDU88_001116 [Pleurodeles waltl]|uniref:Uncharacterized protein n=1 Tax=Pleurodeles waltl TaxID=8319 RepID=A0AAV7UTV4_PLEWA|nr:hypothetical protein NDU88_001116 [Pleurodeles waltl]
MSDQGWSDTGEEVEEVEQQEKGGRVFGTRLTSTLGLVWQELPQGKKVTQLGLWQPRNLGRKQRWCQRGQLNHINATRGAKKRDGQD